MGFLNKLFGIRADDSSKQLKSESKSTGLSHNSVNENQDNLFTNMDEKEIERMVEIFVKDEFYSDNIDDLKTDPITLDAARLVVLKQLGSTSLIQRTFSINYSRSGRIIDELEEFGIIGPFVGDAPRRVNFRNLVDLENYLKKHPILISKKELFYKMHKDLIDSKRIEYLNDQKTEFDRIEKETIKQQIIEKERKKRLHKEALAELIENGEIFNHFTNREGKRESIPQDVMDKVWNRDGGKCAKCGSQENLEFDHIIPFSKGGATTYRNMQLLCKKCNIEKTNRIG